MALRLPGNIDKLPVSLYDVIKVIRTDDMSETLADFRGYLRCLPGAKKAGVIFGTGTWDKGDVYRHPSRKQAYEMGRSI